MDTVKPRALDLFCGAGGATRGLQQAGFHVTGVDIDPQPHYCGDVFIQADAMTFPLDGFDLIWASPPCQGYSRMRHLPWLQGRQYPLLIGAMRQRLEAWGGDWIIENVEDAPMQSGVTLCGTMFGLKVYRHRRFESNVLLMSPPHLPHTETIGAGRMLNDRERGNASGMVSLVGKDPRGAAAMGISWMVRGELAQAIPPAYARYLGEQMIAARSVS